jgi:O-antigen/teichoic acid export membrane protein
VLLAGIPTQMGLPTLLVREISRASHGENWPLVRGLMRFSNVVVMVMSVVGVAVVLLVAAYPRWSPVDNMGLVIAALPLLPLTALGNLRGAILAGMGRVVWGQIPEFVIRPTLFLVGLLVCVLFGYSLTPESAMIINGLAAAITIAAGIMIIRSLAPHQLRSAPAQFEARSWIRALLPLSLITSLQLIRGQLDILILGFMVPEADVGIFKIGAAIALQVTFVLSLINAIFAPKIVRLREARDYAGLRLLMRQGMKLALLAAVPIALVLVIAGRQILRFVFGAEFEPAYEVMVVLAIAQCVYAAAGAVGTLLTMTGNERELTIGIVVAIVTNIGLDLLLIPHYGIVGAAVGSAISMIIWRLLLTALVWKSRVLHAPEV